MTECQKSMMDRLRTSDQISHNAIIYRYTNGVADLVAAERAIFREPGWEAISESEGERAKPAPREADKKSEGEDMKRSMRRARAKMRRLALANDFVYFVTLTLDQTRIDRYDTKAIAKTLRTWCDNMVRRKGLRYILVPELHQDGAIHFHGFFAGKGLEVIDSGTIKRPGLKKPQRPRDEAERAEWMAAGGMVVYNLPQWSLGFSTAISLYGEYPRAVAYCCKYIGKQNGQRPMGRWYYSGGALREPTKEYADIEYGKLSDITDCIEYDTPGGKIAVWHITKGAEL